MMLLTLAVSHVHFHRAILSPPYPRPPARRPARPPAIWVCVQQHVRRIWLQSTPFHSPHRVRWLSIFVPKPSDQKLALNATLLCPHLPFALQRARPIDRWNISLSAPRTTLLRRSLLRSFAQSLARGVASHCSLAVWRCCSLLPLRPLGLACALSGSFAASCAAERSRLNRVRSERPIRKLRRQVAPARHEGGSSSEPPLHRCHVLPLYRSWLLTMANRLWTRSIGCGAHGKVDALALALAFSLAANTHARREWRARRALVVVSGSRERVLRAVQENAPRGAAAQPRQGDELAHGARGLLGAGARRRPLVLPALPEQVQPSGLLQSDRAHKVPRDSESAASTMCARARDADVARDASPAATRPPPPRPRSMLRCGGCTVCRQRVRARTTPPTPTASRSPRPCSSIKRPRAPTLATLPSTSSMCRRVRATSDSREYVCVSLFDPRGAISRIRSLERAC